MLAVIRLRFLRQYCRRLAIRPSSEQSPLATFRAKARNIRRSLAPPLRKKSRLYFLFVCKRTHDENTALPTFCGSRLVAAAAPRKARRSGSLLLLASSSRHALALARAHIIFSTLIASAASVIKSFVLASIEQRLHSTASSASINER